MRKFVKFLIACGIFLLLLLSGVYGLSPFVLSLLVERQLKQQGIEESTVQMGYPGIRSLTVKRLSGRKPIARRMIGFVFRNALIQYDPFDLITGRVMRIHLPDSELEIAHVGDSSDAAVQDKESNEALLPLGALFQPIPTLPVEAVVLDSFTVRHVDGFAPFQHLEISGALSQGASGLHGAFRFQGAETQSYELAISGSQAERLHLRLALADVSAVAVLESTTTVIQDKEQFRIQGQTMANIKEVAAFLNLLLPLPEDVREASGHMNLDWRGVAPKSASVQRLVESPGSKLEGTMHLEGTLPHLGKYGQNLLLQLESQFSLESGRLSVEVAKGTLVSGVVNLRSFSIATRVRSVFPDQVFPFALTVPAVLQGVMHPDTSRGEFRIKTTGTLCMTSDGNKNFPDLRLCLSDFTGSRHRSWEAGGDYRFTGRLQQLSTGFVPFTRSEWDAKGAWQMNSRSVQVSIAPSSHVTVSDVHFREVRVPAMSLRFTDPFSLHYDQDMREWSGVSAKAQATIPEVFWKNSRVGLQKAHLGIEDIQVQSSAWKVRGNVDLWGVSMQGLSFTPPLTHWHSDFVLDPTMLFMQLKGETQNQTLRTQARIKHEWSGQKGVLQLKVFPIEFGPEQFMLSRWVRPWPYPVDISSGKLSTVIHAFWRSDRPGQGTKPVLYKSEVLVGLNKLSGFYKQFLIQDLTTTVRIRGDTAWYRSDYSPLTINKIQTGIDATDVSILFKAAFNPYTQAYAVEGKTVTAKLFGGTISGKGFQVDSTRTPKTFKVLVEGVQVERLLQLEQQEGLHGTGQLDGFIPVSIGEEGVQVSQGQVRARAPGGIIQYEAAEGSSGVLSQTGQHMQLVVDALKNFHYNRLDVGFDYHVDGTLNLRMRLEGKNPDLKKGRPIHFNLNLEENIPSLIKSLRVVRGVEKDIERMLEKTGAGFSGK